MKKYLLDTNICIYYLKGRFSLDKKIAEIGIENCFIPEITVAELKFGAENSEHKLPAQLRRQVFRLAEIQKQSLIIFISIHESLKTF